MRLLLSGIFIIIIGSLLWPTLLGGAYSATSTTNVRRKLMLAELKQGELLVDLGAGDGRVICLAAKEFGANATGIEIDPLRFWFCKLRILLGGLSGMVSVRRENFFAADLSGADVVTFYLSPSAAEKLKHKFEREMKPGSRVASYRRPVPGWRPTRVDEQNHIYVYEMGKSN